MSRSFKPRRFRPWGKKRGSRFFGNRLSGIVGEVFFYLCLTLAGVFGFSLVLLTQLAPHKAPDVTSEAFSDGSFAPWIFGTLSAVAVITGVVGLLIRLSRVGASNERRSVIAGRAASIELVSPSSDDVPRLPSVPQGRLLTDSPGERLTYRLAASNPSQGRVLGPASLALLWNSVWLVLLAVSISGFWSGNPRFILTGLLVPFAGIGVWSFRYFLRQVRQYAGVGLTIVEINDHPLVPGEEFRVFVSQMGRLRLKRLKVELTCEEETFFSQGTDVRVERHPAFTELLCQESSVRVDPQAPWEQQLVFTLPANAMHSFAGSHNAIRWKIVVTGESRPWPSFCRNFPVVVHPKGQPLRRSPR